MGVSVGGTGVSVGGTGVSDGGTGVSVGGTGVSVGGIGVSVGVGDSTELLNHLPLFCVILTRDDLSLEKQFLFVQPDAYQAIYAGLEENPRRKARFVLPVTPLGQPDVYLSFQRGFLHEGTGANRLSQDLIVCASQHSPKPVLPWLFFPKSPRDSLGLSRCQPYLFKESIV
jgi:hypothetical protein